MKIDRFKFRIWDNREKKYLGQDCVEYLHRFYYGLDDVASAHFRPFIRKEQVLEQCTGLRDKNGKLIFEGDILRSPYGAIRTVRWVSNAGCFMSFPQETMSGPVLASAFNVSVIVGNVHEGIKEKK